MSWIFLVAAGILTSLSHVALKYGLTQVNTLVPAGYPVFQKLPYLAGNMFLWLGLIGLGISLLLWLAGLSQVRLNIAYPVLVGLEYSLVMVFSWLILGELLPPFKLAGIACVLIGIIIIAY